MEQSLIRIDKNIAHNIDLFISIDSISNEDKALIKSLIYYFCFSRQTDLFGFGILDPKQFAAALNYKEGYLRKKHPNPLQLQKLTTEEKNLLYEQEKRNPAVKIFDSCLENALYILHTTALRFSRTAKEVVFEKNTTKYTNISKAYILLPELITTTVKGKGSPKIFFNYDINKNFITNLSLYFLKFNKEALITLRRAGLDDLYLYLKNFKETLQEKLKTSTEIDRSLNFNHLCKIARIPLQKKDGSEFENPRDIKQKLIHAFNVINKQTDLKFSVTWAKTTPNTRWKYLPLFFFEIGSEAMASGMYKDIVRRQERMVIFEENLKYELLNCFKQHNYSDKWTEQSMLEWLKSDRDIAEKELAFRTAQYETFGKIHNHIDKMTKAWYTSLSKINSFQDCLKSKNPHSVYDWHKEMYSM
ncbi:MAG: hypothetical protein LBD52_06205 [Prevotellaceae bacterium]|jgi:hypothetical protein|nr:hypothetical protein [Prevotellaceae bacterium]